MRNIIAIVTVAGCKIDGPSDDSGGGTAGLDYHDGDSDTDADADADTDADSDVDEQQPDEEDPAETDTGVTLCDATTASSLWMSPDDSNSMATAVQARSMALTYGSTSGVPIRPWEFLNYYAFDYEPAGPDLLAFDVQMTHDADLPDGEYRLQIGIASEARAVRRPMNLALSIDTSGSMTGLPIGLATDACLAISSSLAEGDIVSVVTWDTAQNRLLSGHAVSGPSDPALDAVCTDLVPRGATDLKSGLAAAYDLANAHADPNRVSRVVLVSDGGANVGQTDEELIGGAAGARDEDGIYLVGVGVGTPTTYNDALMDTVTDIGRGAAVYLDSTSEAWKMFHDRFGEVMDIAVRDVEVRIDLPPTFEILRTSAEEVSEDRTEVEPQHLAPNDTLVFFQHVASCDPTVITDDTPLTVAVIWKDEVTFAPNQIERTFTFGELLAGPSAQLRRGSALLAYAEALDFPSAEKVEYARSQLDLADLAYPGDAELAEIRSVLDAL